MSEQASNASEIVRPTALYSDITRENIRSYGESMRETRDDKNPDFGSTVEYDESTPTWGEQISNALTPQGVEEILRRYEISADAAREGEREGLFLSADEIYDMLKATNRKGLTRRYCAAWTRGALSELTEAYKQVPENLENKHEAGRLKIMRNATFDYWLQLSQGTVNDFPPTNYRDYLLQNRIDASLQALKWGEELIASETGPSDESV
jgi:hypothetical protein